MPKVSVILPNYNHARFLPQRIESILQQTHRDLELLILDDVSTDDSRAVIQHYTNDPRVSTLFNESNSGSPYRQWATGLARTTGEYVWIAESDDYADLSLLARLVALLDAHPRVGLATCDSWEVDEQGRRLARYSDQWRTMDVFADYDVACFDRELVMDGREYCRDFMDPWNTIPNASGVLFRRAALESIGGPVLGMKLCGDWYSYCKILMQYDMGRLPDALNYFRKHAISVRTRVRSVEFVRESMAVQEYIGRELGLPDRHRRSHRVHEFYVQALMAAERTGARNRVPLWRAPAVIANAASFSWTLGWHATRTLVREQAGTVARRLGLRHWLGGRH